ncbi:NeuD/PglB/VioB family sugar acetyltransferase [Microbacterium sp. MYb45]|uniref:NeuD/PglB/VioB family sugar acetyltransferase n=1 Tax=Microbacterium sp. MYb45 TaxID=1827294 RepID=UPI000CFF8D7C|nr:NeuD/PglB/VioB family sugar acetyltransferase [Microbacterium sp. MYb45]PRB64765.1 hypothetical protein CQ034_01045 [Microbacterium sp. MYb45]
MTDIVLLGAGGHARSVLAALALSGDRVRGYLAPVASDRLLGIEHLGGDDVLDAFDPEDVAIVVALGSTSSTALRRTLHIDAVSRGFTIATVVHPRAFVDPSVVLPPGVQVLAGSIVNAGARIGEGALINSGAIVEHDSVVGAHAHIAPGAVLAGDVTIGEGAHIGLGSRIVQGVTVGSGGVVGAGAVVITDVPAQTTVVGVPARPIEDKRMRNDA